MESGAWGQGGSWPVKAKGPSSDQGSAWPLRTLRLHQGQSAASPGTNLLERSVFRLDSTVGPDLRGRRLFRSRRKENSLLCCWRSWSSWSQRSWSKAVRHRGARTMCSLISKGANFPQEPARVWNGEGMWWHHYAYRVTDLHSRHWGATGHGTQCQRRHLTKNENQDNKEPEIRRKPILHKPDKKQELAEK